LKCFLPFLPRFDKNKQSACLTLRCLIYLIFEKEAGLNDGFSLRIFFRQIAHSVLGEKKKAHPDPGFLPVRKRRLPLAAEL